MQYWTRFRGRVEGPFSTEELLERVRRGKFSRLFEVSTDGQKWSSATQFPELFVMPIPPTRKRVSNVSSQQSSVVYAEKVPEETNKTEIYDLAKGDKEGYDPEVSVIQAGSSWHYIQGEAQYGPVDFAELQYYAAVGRLKPQDLVWTENMPDWTPAEYIDGIFPSNFPGSTANQSLSPLALASFILGILGMTIAFFIGSLIAIILGHIALTQIRNSEGRLRGRPLAITGLVLGYLVIVVTILACFVILLIILLGSRSLPS
jgi:hypothetical protein